jgi:hypothetical protein
MRLMRRILPRVQNPIVVIHPLIIASMSWLFWFRVSTAPN